MRLRLRTSLIKTALSRLETAVPFRISGLSSGDKAQFALELGISQEQLSRYEQGRARSVRL